MTFDAERRPLLLGTAAVVVGVLLRIRQFLDNRSLWLDEAMVTLNIASRSFRGLLRPLSDDQSAPVPFLWSERLAIQLFGVREQALRFLPLLAGVLGLLLFWRWVRRVLDPSAATLATVLFALAPALIYYSNEVKPYSCDALLALLIGWNALELCREPVAPKHWRNLLVTGVVATVSSAPAPFVLAAAIAALALSPAIREDRALKLRVVGLAALWAGAFAATYFMFYRTAVRDTYLQIFWDPYFLTPFQSGWLAKTYAAVGNNVMVLFFGSGGLWRLEAAMGVVVIGALGIWRLRRRGDWSLLALLAGPIAAAVAASMLHRYPVAPRLMLFATPFMIGLIALGVEEMVGRLPERLRRPGFAMLALGLLVLPILTDAREAIDPPHRQHLRPLVAEFRRQHRPDDVIYVFGRATPAWTFYTTDWHSPDLSRVRFYNDLVSSYGLAFRGAPSRGHAVRQEGGNLQFNYMGALELIGIPTGQGPSATSRGQELPDSGWADNEARRILRARQPGSAAWTIFSFYQEDVVDELVASLEQGGAVLDGRWEESDALLLRFEFSSRADLAER